MIFAAFVCDRHQRRGGEVWHVGNHSHHAVMRSGWHRHNFCAEASNDGPKLREDPPVGLRRWSKNPYSAAEQFRVRTVDAFTLGTSHWMAADEPRVGNCRDDGRLHTADVGDKAGSVLQQTVSDRWNRLYGRRDKADLRFRVYALYVNGTDIERSLSVPLFNV